MRQGRRRRSLPNARWRGSRWEPCWSRDPRGLTQTQKRHRCKFPTRCISSRRGGGGSGTKPARAGNVGTGRAFALEREGKLRVSTFQCLLRLSPAALWARWWWALVNEGLRSPGMRKKDWADMAGRSKSPHRGPWVRCLALLGLVAYLGGMGWFMTLCTAAVALVDGEHSVRIESRQQGFLVILGHDRSARHPERTHSHDWIADLLTSLASDSLTSGGDHVIDLDRDPGLAARSGEASLRDLIARNATGSVITAFPLPAVAPSSRPHRQTSIGVQSTLAPSLCVSRIHVLRC